MYPLRKRTVKIGSIMSLLKWILYVFFGLGLVACAQDQDPTKIDLQLISIEVTHNKPAKGRCQLIGPVMGTSYGQQNKAYQAAIRDLKIHTLQEGGNYVRVLASMEKGQLVKGTAYKCAPKEEEEEEEPPPEPKKPKPS